MFLYPILSYVDPLGWFSTGDDADYKLECLGETLWSTKASLSVVIHGFVDHETAAAVGQKTHQAECTSNVSSKSTMAHSYCEVELLPPGLCDPIFHARSSPHFSASSLHMCVATREKSVPPMRSPFEFSRDSGGRLASTLPACVAIAAARVVTMSRMRNPTKISHDCSGHFASTLHACVAMTAFEVVKP